MTNFFLLSRGGDWNAEVAFSSILSAPLLEAFYIDVPKINFSDNATVIARIARRDILQNLKTFGMYQTMRINSEDDLLENSYLESFTELRNAITSANSGVQNAEYQEIDEF